MVETKCKTTGNRFHPLKDPIFGVLHCFNLVRRAHATIEPHVHGSSKIARALEDLELALHSLDEMARALITLSKTEMPARQEELGLRASLRLLADRFFGVRALIKLAHGQILLRVRGCPNTARGLQDLHLAFTRLLEHAEYLKQISRSRNVLPSEGSFFTVTKLNEAEREVDESHAIPARRA
jgi:hypothetical protein